MRLFALRGATSVRANDAPSIRAATAELMTEILARNGLTPASAVSCLFTTTEDLDAEFPAAAARECGFEAVPLICAREIAVPGLAAARRARADALLRRRGARARSRLPSRGAGIALGPRGRPPVEMALEFSERVARIPPYPVAGGYGRQAPRVRLASNESPFGMLPGVEQAIADHTATLNRYPDPDAVDLRRRLAERHGVPAAQIAVGAGSCELLMLLGEALLEPGAEIVHAWPSFSVYPHLSAASGARAVTVPLDRQWRHDLPAMLAEITVATRIVIVCNPNNPTSTALEFEQLAEFIATCPAAGLRGARRGLLRVQPAAATANSRSRCSRIPESRAAADLLEGLRPGGLRVGYALCGSTEVPAALDRVRQPFNSTALAQVAAGAALDAGDAVLERVAMTVAERIMVAERLTAMGLRVADSQANFCWVELGEQRDEAQIVAGLADRGVLVRAGAALGSDVPALRVTYGLPEEDESFLAALAEVLQM